MHNIFIKSIKTLRFVYLKYIFKCVFKDLHTLLNLNYMYISKIFLVCLIFY